MAGVSRAAVFAAVLVGALAGAACRPSGSFATPAGDAASIAVTETTPPGDVRADREAAWLTAKVGDRASSSGAVRTGPRGSMWLDVAGGGVAQVRENTELAVEELASAQAAGSTTGAGETLLELLQGTGLFHWEGGGGLTVKTPHVHAAVLGTDFAVEVTPRGTRVLVVHGKVRVEKGVRETIVSARGQCVTPADGDPGRPEPVSMRTTDELATALDRFADTVRNLGSRRGIERR